MFDEATSDFDSKLEGGVQRGFESMDWGKRHRTDRSSVFDRRERRRDPYPKGRGDYGGRTLK